MRTQTIEEHNKSLTFNTSTGQSITDDGLKQTLISALSDDSSRNILDAIIDVPKSILEISNVTQIPIRTVYRKIQLLHDSKLLKISGTITDSGKKYFLYKSRIHSITVCYQKNSLMVSMIKN